MAVSRLSAKASVLMLRPRTSNQALSGDFGRAGSVVG
jgi:hypothetical protein